MAQKILREEWARAADTDLAFLTDVGSNIRYRRVSLGVNIEEISTIIGITSFDLEKIESGQADVFLEDLILIAKSLNCTAYDLVATSYRCGTC